MSVSHKVAVLIANGFNEKELSVIQKKLISQNMVAKMVSSENGVVNGWADNSWGCFFSVDDSINQALASDYSGLIIMGGDKSIQRLLKTAHTERFVNSFVRVGKPVLALDDAHQVVSTEESVVTHVETVSQDMGEVLDMFLVSVQGLDIEMDMAA
ncbi:MAG: DJ-1/PfpI family protein [Alphaproteobacteria bacterium]|nr:DJ-1/PfpI family protein [Alphaproteobacteria bacterium]